MSGTPTPTPTPAPESGAPAPSGDPTPQGTTFTQADIDRIVKDRLAQQAKNQFGDYDDLKSKAAGAKTLEDRLGTLESELSATKAEALRTSIAARFKVSTEKGPKGEPSDADLFLTGTDEASLIAQAERLAGRDADRKKQGNFAPKEGTTPKGDPGSEDLREFTRKLFNKQG